MTTNTPLNVLPFTSVNLRSLLLEKLDVPESDFDEQENLFDYGLDSVDVMGLISHLQTQGIQVSFIDLVTEPTFDAWRRIIDNR